MVDFNKLLRQSVGEARYAEIQQHRAAEEAETLRVFNLPDRMLARHLVTVARAMRAIPNSAFSRWGPEDPVYDASLVWHCLPELAQRLGETQFLPSERNDPRYRNATGAELRWFVSHTWRNANIPVPLRRQPAQLSTVGRDPIDGNPMFFAIDRIFPVEADYDDPLMKEMAATARRRGVAFDGRWTPALIGLAAQVESESDEVVSVTRMKG